MRMSKIISIIMIGFMFAMNAIAGEGGEEYQLDKPHSRVGFSAKHMVLTTVRGEFNDWDATLMIDKDNFTNSSLEGTIQVASIDTKNEKRDNHLRSEDFFYAEKYPEIKFQSKKIRKDGDGYIMIGDLTMRGVTKEIEFPFTITGVINDPSGKTRIGFETEFTLNRKDFGINWNKTLDTGGLVVSVDITVDIVGEAVSSEPMAN